MENLFIVLLVFLTLVLFKLFNRNNEPFISERYNRCVLRCKNRLERTFDENSYNTCLKNCSTNNI